MTYTLKTIPEDFIVIELSNVETLEQGAYMYFRLRKRNWNTLSAVKEIGKKLHLNMKHIGFAGSKDKHAVTEQLVSLMGRKKEQILKLDIVGIELEFVGFGKKPISLGDLESNYFEIVVRDAKKQEVDAVSFSENYFDEQRFSSHNAEIGKMILLKKFKDAVALVDDERVHDYLKKKKNDVIGALRLLPKRLLRMYVNAYQSKLWNETVARYLQLKGDVLKEVEYSQGKLLFTSDVETFKDVTIPLIGFGTELSALKEDLVGIIKEIMNEEEIRLKDFVIKQLPDLTLEGEERRIVIPVEKFDIGKWENDELHEGKQKMNVSFVLPKGSYATMVIKRLFS